MSTKVERSRLKKLQFEKVTEYMAKGRSQRQISTLLGCSLGSVNACVKRINEERSEQLKHYLNQLIPERHANCITGINVILDEAWNIVEQTEEEKVKLGALSLARDCIALQSDLIVNSAVIGEAAKFIDRSKAQLIAVQVEQKLDQALAADEQKSAHQRNRASTGSKPNKPTNKKQASESVF